MSAAHEAAQTTKQKYEAATIKRSNSQREVDNLSRKHPLEWTDAESVKFTTFVHEGRSYGRAEAQARDASKAADRTVERELKEYLKSLRARYHEEKIWSDKIRVVTSALYFLTLIVTILVVEPLKSRGLVHTFEKKVEELSEEITVLLEKEIRKLETRPDAVMRTIPPSQPPSPVSIEVETVSVPPGPMSLPYRLYSGWCSIPHKLEGGLVASALALGWVFYRHR